MQDLHFSKKGLTKFDYYEFPANKSRDEQHK